jgi:2-keto-4-pentenoate hydratase/2-oxohepta-3-ene-1,7-dioic acid hydratase in catechol pathway
MKLMTIKGPDGLRLGVKTDAGVVDIAAAAAAAGVSAPATVSAVIAGGDAAKQQVADIAAKASGAAVLAESSVAVGPAVPTPGKIICIGLNYRKHAIETGAAIPEVPVIFSKFNNTICAPGDDVPLPSVAREYDWEVELGFVMGKRAHNVSKADALDYVFGYVAVDDLSVRDLQTRTSQWLLGKTLDNFLPNGPYLVTSDEVPDPQVLPLKCWVNGNLVQNSNTNDMIFTIAEIIEYITRYFPLEPGDMIITGTPEGVAMGRPDKPWLKPGDVVTVEIEGVGRLTNKMVS